MPIEEFGGISKKVTFNVFVNPYLDMIPLMIDTSSLRVLVFGNGPVGMRKAAYFQGKCAEVAFSLRDDPTGLEVQIAPYDIIIAATNDTEFNCRVCTAARNAGKWYNSANEPGNFLIPATVTAGDVTIAVSTSGKSPALAAFLRDSLLREYPSLEKMIELQNNLREELKDKIPEQSSRAAMLRAVLDSSEIWKALDENDMDKARKLAGELL